MRIALDRPFPLLIEYFLLEKETATPGFESSTFDMAIKHANEYKALTSSATTAGGK